MLVRYKKDVEAEVEAHLDPSSGVDKSWRRNAELARVMFRSIGDSFSDSDTPGNHVVKYLQKNGDTSRAFAELRPIVQDMDGNDSRVLLSSFLDPQGSFSLLNQDVGWVSLLC